MDKLGPRRSGLTPCVMRNGEKGTNPFPFHSHTKHSPSVQITTHTCSTANFCISIKSIIIIVKNNNTNPNISSLSSNKS